MKLLLLGGTAWLGRAIAASALAAGHDVTCATRGDGIPAGAHHVRADRDESDGLAPLRGERWDAVIDVARQPGHVRRAVDELRTEHYVFVSTCNVYADQSEIGADESAALLAPLEDASYTDPEEYGRAKVACEAAVLAGFGSERSAIVRPGLIGGPGDPSGRTTYWPRRFARPSTASGAVVVPDAPDLPTAIIDVRDLAEWLVRLAEGAASGVFNAQGDPLPFPSHLAAAGGVGSPHPVSEALLTELGVAQWSGPRSLPLWLADHDWYGMNARSTRRAKAAGLTLRPLRDTLADSLEGPTVVNAGLTDDDERMLLDEIRRRPARS